MSKIKVLITGGNGDIARGIEQELLNTQEYEILAPSKDVMDVMDVVSIERVISSFRPDVLINNAGYISPKSIRNGDIENSKKQIDINLGGVFFCTEVALKYNSNIQIINIGSAAAVEPHATWSEYCATKAAVVMATKCWAEDGLYSVVLSPGRTNTKMRKNLFPEEDQETLLMVEDFAKVVMKAIKKEYKSGTHIIVRKQNVKELLSK